MSTGIELILSATLAATLPGCTWAHPGANPYRGDPVRALVDFDLPPATRDALRALLRARRPTDTATITRDDIVGSDGAYTDLREMHSGHGRVCHGPVDRSAWSAQRREKALVYCADDACVIVPVICHNVSLVSRKPEHAAENDGPLDIEPAAGPPQASAPSTPPPEGGPLGFVQPPEGGGNGGAPPVDSTPPGVPIAEASPDGGNSGGGDGSPPDVPLPGGPPPGGGLPCCDTPARPGNPGAPPVVTPVPESPAWTLLLTGLAALRPWRRRGTQRRGRARTSPESRIRRAVHRRPRP